MAYIYKEKYFKVLVMQLEDFEKQGKNDSKSTGSEK